MMRVMMRMGMIGIRGMVSGMMRRMVMIRRSSPFSSLMVSTRICSVARSLHSSLCSLHGPRRPFFLAQLCLEVPLHGLHLGL